MRTLLVALTALMLFATPVMAGDWEDGVAAFEVGDYQKAFRIWKPLAEQGHVWAQYNLGRMYDEGKGVPEDDSNVVPSWAAVYWWRKAAEQGEPWAQYNLGRQYANGEGVPEDDAKAVYWYRKAAVQGDVMAQANLGMMYAKGKGVPPNYVQAHAWWSIAAAQGNEDAKNNKGIIKKEMTSAQIARGQELSFELWENYVVPFQKN